ncbi:MULTISPECIES: hypothetical protein [unclassified Mesorhizobium]|uniref:hypothetical protein n=1 Tax=unclassified Mesorhizobium TaxID=325217 RepID=UPI0013E07909|nr:MULTISPECIES: hypothetical protein [unclassified Mesorhizobium]
MTGRLPDAGIPRISPSGLPQIPFAHSFEHAGEYRPLRIQVDKPLPNARDFLRKSQLTLQVAGHGTT